MTGAVGEPRPDPSAPLVGALSSGASPLPSDRAFVSEREALEARILRYNPDSDVAMIRRAFDLGARAHSFQDRKSGEPYFTHPIAVANLLADLRLDDASIATALLHDVVEDTGYTRNDISDLFGEEIAALVAGVTKLSEIEERDAVVHTREEAQAENFRKLILAVARDARVLLVKLADRLHNMRTLGSMPAHKQDRIATETMEVYAPLAGRMGMQEMREELEDLAIRVLAPGARMSVLRRFVSLRRKHGAVVVTEVEKDIEDTLAEIGIKARVASRQKRPYSIWRKLQEDKVGFESLSDIVAFRIVVDSIDACYLALGAVHRKWRVVPGRFKDYISNPKTNGYRSIHTTVIGPNGWRVEVQVRTIDMHEHAERGVAAHWSYRDGIRADNPYSVGPTVWLKDVLGRLEQGARPDEFLEHVKLEMYHDQVFCFTPKGDVRRLPRGATALDFAYAIHTNLGNSCVGARIDGHQASFWKELRNGQSVEILRSDGQQPTIEWEDMVITGRAKSAIRRALREIERTEVSRFGKQLLDRAFTKAGYELDEDDMISAIAVLDYADVDALFAAVGASELHPDEVFEAANPNRDASDEIARREEPAVFLRGAQRSPIHHFCPICLPIPFERIIGVVDRKQGGVMVHRIDCSVLEEDEADDTAEDWLDMFWGEGADSVPRYHTRAALILANEPGALGSVCTGVGALGANIENLRIVERKPSYYRVIVDLEVCGARHLNKILRALDRQPRVDRVDRIGGLDDAPISAHLPTGLDDTTEAPKETP